MHLWPFLVSKRELLVNFGNINGVITLLKGFKVNLLSLMFIIFGVYRVYCPSLCSQVVFRFQSIFFKHSNCDFNDFYGDFKAGFPQFLRFNALKNLFVAPQSSFTVTLLCFYDSV